MAGVQAGSRHCPLRLPAFVPLSALPALVHALPVERSADLHTARTGNVWLPFAAATLLFLPLLVVYSALWLSRLRRQCWEIAAAAP